MVVLFLAEQVSFNSEGITLITTQVIYVNYIIELLHHGDQHYTVKQTYFPDKVDQVDISNFIVIL